MQKHPNGESPAAFGKAASTDLLDDIRFQARLLALNAAIEAARAGSPGGTTAALAARIARLADRGRIAALKLGAMRGRVVRGAVS